jgi:NAD(P)H-hydrate epimerase
MGRLTGLQVPEIQENRIAIALEYAAKWSKVVVLKGARTVVAAPDGQAAVIATGGPNLATAGTGDILSGTIGGLLAQGCSPWSAAVAGAYLHGLAGDLVRAQYGDAGTIASDLLDQLPIARNRILKEREP